MPDRLGDARRANGARIERERRSYDNTEARRAIGRRIESERRGAVVQDEINSLVRPTQTRPNLRTIDPVGALPPKRGRSDYTAKAAATGGGIASPLTETDYAAREYHPARMLTSSDGLFVWAFEPIKKIVMNDANAAEVEQIFAVPV